MKQFWAWRRVKDGGLPQWVPLKGREVKHPWAKLWAYKEGRMWNVIEQQSGMRISYDFTLKNAVADAEQILVKLGSENVNAHVAKKLLGREPMPPKERMKINAQLAKDKGGMGLKHEPTLRTP